MSKPSAAMEGDAAAPFGAPLDITVLMGGPSTEREVSLMSGTAIAEALERCGHKVQRADISPRDTSALDRAGLDVAFIALHGSFGESGDVQQLCEARGLAYTGSGPEASRLALDKAAAKQRFRRAGLTTPDWIIVEQYHAPAQVRGWLAELPLPVVCKPVDGGSSVDITIARSESERDTALVLLLDGYGRAMIERYAAGRELTVGILGEEPLPVLEVVPAGDFYDYRAKYADDAGTRYEFDHGLDEPICERLREAAMAAHHALGCRDMSRVDFILDEAGEAQVLEVNTIPGFTSHSLLPMAAGRVGISFESLAGRLVTLAHSRASSR